MAILVVVAAAGAAGWLASARDRTTLYQPPTPVTRVELVLASGSAEISGSRATTVRVERIDRYAFGHPAVERRSLAGGVLRLSSACPRILVGACSASYRLSVPDGVSVSVRTGAGRVRLDGFRGTAQIQTGSGAISVDAFCGFVLSATSGSGDIRAVSACAPRTLDLRTTGGNATALVPPGRYRVDARSVSGQVHVRGVVPSDQVPLSISVQSRSGDVTVGGGL